jgi:hypothetical protein
MMIKGRKVVPRTQRENVARVALSLLGTFTSKRKKSKPILCSMHGLTLGSHAVQ